MDVFKLLKKEHDEVDEILKKFEKLDEEDTKERDQLFDILKKELTRHMSFEEQNLYNQFKREQSEEELHDKSFEADEEHYVIKVLLSELDKSSSDKEQWTAKLKVLKENIEHHVKEEEDDIFPMAKKNLTKEKIQELTQKLESQREHLKVSV